LWNGQKLSYGYAEGKTYIHLSGKGIYTLDLLAKTIDKVTITGLVDAYAKGITAAANYIVSYDDTTVYWSSTLDVTDFVPSLATGAGSGTPTGLNGKIITCLPLGTGFAVYSAANIVNAGFSGNTRYPWIFKPAANSGGITSEEDITFDGDEGTNYAWTSAGLMKVAPQGCTLISPETTDFLAGRIFEDYDTTTDVITQEYLASDLQIKLAYIAARYLVISYAKAEATVFTHALVYDTAFKRWGKLKVNHVDCFELNVQTSTVTTWAQLSATGKTWAQLSAEGITWADLGTVSNDAANPRRTMGFLQENGAIKVAILDYGNFASDAVLILGKYQLTRSRMSNFLGFNVETIDASNANFNVHVLTTLDGKTDAIVSQPYEQVKAAKVRNYLCKVVGANHSIVFKGAFNLSSILLTLSQHGKR
jgi:hypothetical protein